MEAEAAVAIAAEAPEPKLIKGLASCNTAMRSKSLKALLNWLPTQTLLSDDVMKKLWKSLFYCMWHCDKIQNQTHLINRLSSLLYSLSPPVSLSYFSNFLVTMRREWPGIDHLRLDKFYLLIRYFVRNLFVLLRNVDWDLYVLNDFIEVLEKRAFFVDDDEVKGLGNGVTYHVVSVFCEELKPFLSLRMDVLNLLFRPFIGVLEKSNDKVLVGKVKSYVFDYLIKNGKGLVSLKNLSEVDEKDEVVLFGKIAVGMWFSTKLYDLGSCPNCLQGNRKVVFGLHEEFLKLEKETMLLKFDVSLPVYNAGHYDEDIPQLIPINGEKMDDESKVVASTKGGKAKASKDKKSKKKKKKKSDGDSMSDTSVDAEVVNSNDDNSNTEGEDGANMLVLNENVISNLQKQFEKIAAESGLDGDGVSALESTPVVKVNGKVSKKRKRTKSVAKAEIDSKEVVEEEAAGPKTEEKSVKRVRFAMKNNLVWKPHSPLPPQNVRIPPSVTPRGSALKKGLSPGPIREASQEVKKAKKKKKASPLKKARKVKKLSPAVKRVKKVKQMSA